MIAPNLPNGGWISMPKIEINSGFVLSIKRYNDKSFLLDIFSPEHGRYVGLYRAKNAPQPATFVQGRWQARLSEQLGTFYLEPINAFSAAFLDDKKRLATLLSACYLIEKTIPERQPYPELYAALQTFLNTLTQDDFLKQYAFFEMALLTTLGFGLDLSACANDGATQHLLYVSPKSGRAVCQTCGAPYRDKLLPLPAFLHTPDTSASNTDIYQALTLTGFFLKQHTGIELPLTREQLMR